MPTRSLPRLRRTSDADGVTNVELFFDLVYVFAVTQLSHLLVGHTTVVGALETAVLLAMVWQVWVYTTWVVNYLDPGHYSVRLLLLVLMAASLVLAAEIPRAFGDRGLLVALLYVGVQAGRSLFAVLGTRGDTLLPVFGRILPWTAVSGAVMIVGAVEHGYLRIGLWALSVAIDLFGASVGFWLPHWGRSRSSDWTISGGHFAERCQAFVLIALGESVVVIGTRLAAAAHPSAVVLGTFAIAFAGTVALWWVYFDRSAEDSAAVIAASDDPGRLARSAFHWVHPLLIAGIIVAAAADEKVLEDPTEHVSLPLAWLVLGGSALYLAGHALFKAVVWRTVSWPRVIAAVVLLLMLSFATHVSGIVLAGVTLAVVVAVAVADRVTHPALY